ncbi:unnamed protein product [Rangifer tarandus platyrhynchus]|uniref:Uncharacterized protein n=1 Tax=Rangifer tarandus platyrhynchus TaxID=3082113 RepID=A0AC59ZJQ2_RANTA
MRRPAAARERERGPKRAPEPEPEHEQGTPGARRAAPPPSALATGFVFRKHFRWGGGGDVCVPGKPHHPLPVLRFACSLCPSFLRGGVQDRAGGLRESPALTSGASSWAGFGQLGYSLGLRMALFAGSGLEGSVHPRPTRFEPPGPVSSMSPPPVRDPEATEMSTAAGPSRAPASH